MLRIAFKEMPILSSIMAIIILGCVFMLVDGIASKPKSFYGNVVDKHYKAERRSVGTGTVVGSNGGVGFVTTTEVDPEEFLIMVKTQCAGIVTVRCDAELYYQKELGERIDCNDYKGLFTGLTWGLYGVR